MTKIFTRKMSNGLLFFYFSQLVCWSKIDEAESVRSRDKRVLDVNLHGKNVKFTLHYKSHLLYNFAVSSVEISI